MPNSSPAWVRQVQVTVVVENEPVPEQPSTEYALDTYGSYSGNSAILQTLFEREVPTGRIGILDAVELDTDHYGVALFYVVVKGVEILDEETIPTAFTKDFPGLHLAAGESVLVQVRSDGTTGINAWADVSYKEVG